MSGELDIEAVERIELKIAFLERANHELSDVVYRQQQEIRGLEARLTALAARFAAREMEQRAYSLEDEKPPHY